MGIFLNRGVDAFERALKSEIYVDKTGLLEYCSKVIDTEQSYICVSRPRRFGKSMAAGMLEAYYQKYTDTEGMFAGLKVSQNDNWKQHLNKYDVIKIDIAEAVSDTGDVEKALNYIEINIVKDLDRAYPGILTADEKTVTQALSCVNRERGNKFVVIIDEWDCFFRDDNCTDAFQKRYINLLRALFKSSSSKHFIALAYITGIRCECQK